MMEVQYSTRVIVRFPVEPWCDDHRVAVVYESYGPMLIDFWYLDGSYCTIQFTLKYKLSITNTLHLAARLVDRANCNRTLQTQFHSLAKP